MVDFLIPKFFDFCTQKMKLVDSNYCTDLPGIYRVLPQLYTKYLNNINDPTVNALVPTANVTTIQ